MQLADKQSFGAKTLQSYNLTTLHLAYKKLNFKSIYIIY